MMNARSRLTGIATGDQGIFVTRALFEAVGGFPAQPLMEDIELSRRLKRDRGSTAVPARANRHVGPALGTQWTVANDLRDVADALRLLAGRRSGRARRPI